MMICSGSYFKNPDRACRQVYQPITSHGLTSRLTLEMDRITMKRPLFDEVDLLRTLESLSSVELDSLEFGLIGFDQTERITLYNAPEAQWAGLTQSTVIGDPLFETVAPCMNNYMVAERFRNALQKGISLDETLDYVLTLRMRPTPVTLRILANPQTKTRFILIRRKW